jgi:hypothetical protein
MKLAKIGDVQVTKLLNNNHVRLRKFFSVANIQG